MIIVKYGSDGMKSVINEDADRAAFSRLYQRKKKEAEEDEDMYVSWLNPYTFEVTNDRWAAGYIFKLRPDNWPRNNGEPL